MRTRILAPLLLLGLSTVLVGCIFTESDQDQYMSIGGASHCSADPPDVSAYRQHLLPSDFTDDLPPNFRPSLKLRSAGEFIFMKGTVTSNADTEFKQVLEQNPNARVVVLTNVDGSVDDVTNAKLAKEIHDLCFVTYLPKEGFTASGGVDFMLAGKQRYIEEGGEVGVHAWDDSGSPPAAQLPKTDARHSLYLDYYNYVGAPQDFYWFTLETPAEDLHFMTREELELYKVFTTYIES